MFSTWNKWNVCLPGIHCSLGNFSWFFWTTNFSHSVNPDKNLVVFWRREIVVFHIRKRRQFCRVMKDNLSQLFHIYLIELTIKHEIKLCIYTFIHYSSYITPVVNYEDSLCHHQHEYNWILVIWQKQSSRLVLPVTTLHRKFNFKNSNSFICVNSNNVSSAT